MQRREFAKKICFSTFLGIIHPKLFGYSDSFYLPNIQLIGTEKPFLCGNSYLLLPEVFDAFENMRIAAQKDGIKLWGSSGYRTFLAQKTIWNKKYKKLQADFPRFSPTDIVNCIVEYTAIPGTSRHHWGTDIDIIDAMGYANEQPLTEEHFSEKGDYQYLNYWLSKYAIEFGFCQVYTQIDQRTGFKYEPWHYSYFSLSKKIVHQICEYSFDEIKEMQSVLGNEIINKSFLSNYIQNYMFGIDNRCF